MKKMLFTAVILLMAVMANAKDIKTVTLTTDPVMHCESCENKIKNNLKYVPGIKDIVASAESQTVTVTYDADKTSVEKMQNSLKKAGYTATVKQGCGKCKEGADKQCCGKCKEGAEKKCCKEGADKQCCGKCKEGADKKHCGKCKEGAEKKGDCCKK